MADHDQEEYQEFKQESREVRFDLKRVLWTNGLILVALIALYFINRGTGFLNF